MSAPTPPSPSSPADILVVDDNPNNLAVLAAMLAAHGLRARPAISGQIALNAAFGRPPDLVLLDVRMADMDGYEVCRRLKADERTREIPVLFLSALENVEDKVKAFESGGVDYITKPFQEVEVITRLQTHLALSQARKLAAEKAAFEERRRLARELHDSVAQLLSSLGLYIQGWKLRLDQDLDGGVDKDEMLQWLEQVGEIANQSLKEMRLLIYQMDTAPAPAAAGAGGLEEALRRRLEAVEQRARVKASLEVNGDVALSPEAGRELFLVAQEALNNALKHARASTVCVTLSAEPDRLRLQVEDDGVGFSPAEVEKCAGMGIKSMIERARRLGGSLNIDSNPGQGTRVRVEIPTGDRQ